MASLLLVFVLVVLCHCIPAQSLSSASNCIQPARPSESLVHSFYASSFPPSAFTDPVYLAYSVVTECPLLDFDGTISNTSRKLESLVGSIVSAPYSSDGFSAPIFEILAPAIPVFEYRVYRLNMETKNWHRYTTLSSAENSFYINSWTNYGPVSPLPKVLFPLDASSDSAPVCKMPPAPPAIVSHWYDATGHDPTVSGSGQISLSYSQVIQCESGLLLESPKTIAYTTPFNTILDGVRYSRPAVSFPQTTTGVIAFKVYRTMPDSTDLQLFNTYPASSQYFFIDYWNNVGAANDPSVCGESYLPRRLISGDYAAYSIDKAADADPDGNVYMAYSIIMQCDNGKQMESRLSPLRSQAFNYYGWFDDMSQPIFQFPDPSGLPKAAMLYKVYRYFPISGEWYFFGRYELTATSFTVTSWAQTAFLDTMKREESDAMKTANNDGSLQSTLIGTIVVSFVILLLLVLCGAAIVIMKTPMPSSAVNEQKHAESTSHTAVVELTGVRIANDGPTFGHVNVSNDSQLKHSDISIQA